MMGKTSVDKINIDEYDHRRFAKSRIRSKNSF